MREGRYYANAWSCLVVLKLLNLLLHIVSVTYPPIREQVGYCHNLVFWNAISLGDILLQICRGHCDEVAQLHDVAYVLLPFWIVECVIPSVVYWNVLVRCCVVNLIHQPEPKLNGQGLEEVLNQLKVLVSEPPLDSYAFDALVPLWLCHRLHRICVQHPEVVRHAVQCCDRSNTPPESCATRISKIHDISRNLVRHMRLHP